MLLNATKLLIAKRNGKGNTSALPVCGVALSVVEVRPCSNPFRLNVLMSSLIGAPDPSEWIHPGGPVRIIRADTNISPQGSGNNLMCKIIQLFPSEKKRTAWDNPFVPSRNGLYKVVKVKVRNGKLETIKSERP